MNEVVSQLATRAEATKDTGGKWIRSEGFEKFVELMVEEFIHINNLSPDLSQKTKDHFGVKTGK